MKVLIACECSGKVRRAFRALGHDAHSYDLQPADDGERNYHHQRDVSVALMFGVWDLVIAFPPCTHLACSGARHFAEKRADGRQQEAALFFMDCIMASAPRVAVENPIGIMSTHYRKPDQIIQPWHFGHGETKATCLWLKGLPKLVPTNIVAGRADRIHKMPPGPNRAKLRSETYDGIAQAMANQWGT